MSEKRFVIHDSSVQEYVESLENKNTQGKTKRDVKLLNDFLRGEKKEEVELSAITPEDLDRYLAEFIHVHVRTHFSTAVICITTT